MRLKSLLATVLTGLLCLGFVGCGSSGTGSEFVATTADQPGAQNGALTFNFVTAQSAFTVDGNTATLLFEFFDGTSVTPVFSQAFPFAASITVENVPLNAGTVVITSIDENGFPLQTITQAIAVQPGAVTVVDGIANAVSVNLSNLRLAPGNLVEFDEDLVSVALAAGTTFQVFLFAEYDNGAMVLVGENGTYDIPEGDAGIATINEQGTITGVAPGTTAMSASFGGLTLNRPVTVTDGEPIIFDSLSIVNASPIQVAAGTPVPLFLTGGVGGSGSFPISATDVNVAYTFGGTDFSVVGGELTAAALAAVTSTDTMTVTFTNIDASTVTAMITVEVIAAAP